ncbi:MAG TPA: sigma-70 family RNA polymerase sigma factor [Tepidisphaeraceae bacterium]|nr:sigma-70 family RNA polymerase sigma factor [Tepidisphaeraceae bacterium]
MEHRLTQLLDAHGRGLHALMLRMTLDREAAADLFQDLFARLAGSTGFANAEDRPAFAYRAAINLAHDWRRRRRRTPPMTSLPEQLIAPNGPPVVLPDELARALDAIGQLGQPARDAICLRYLKQMSYAEVGRTIGRSAHQARALCHAGIGRIRRLLADERRVHRVTP